MPGRPVFITDLVTFPPKALLENHAQLTVEALRWLRPCGGCTPDAVEWFACGSSAAGTCISVMTAFKYARMKVADGLSGNAVVVGWGLASACRQTRLESGVDTPAMTGLEHQIANFCNADVLLANGVGAAFLTPDRPAYRQALRIDWVDDFSFANESLTTAFGRTLSRLVSRRGLTPRKIDWVLHPYASDDYRRELHDHLRAIGFEIPDERWVTNRDEKKNAGAAAIYILLEELVHSGRLRTGDRLLCCVPESGCFSIGFMHLTVV